MCMVINQKQVYAFAIGDMSNPSRSADGQLARYFATRTAMSSELKHIITY